ncbi:MAG: copper amine oxidase N-terminal domain-containing protein [Firmicutes bacterium]|nr:copper amine oxidase N-terminal domain-containing protein [Bacillota bacterium]
MFRWAGRRWARRAQTPYVWSPVVSVQAGSLDGDDRAELVVLSASGDLAVFGWTGTDVALVWRWSGENGPVLQAQVADVTGDGVSELVAVDGAGRVTVWGWPFGDPVGQGFVWGTPVSMTVADIEGAGRQEVLVTTAERLLYRFGWQNSQLALLGAPVDDRTLPLEQMTPVPHPESGAVLLAGRSASGMGLFRIGGQGIEQVALGWAQAPQWMIPVPGGRGLVVAEEGRAPSIWTLEESDYFRLRADGQSVSVQDPPLLREDTVLLSMRDWASLFGWTLYWDPELRRLTAVGRNGFAILTVGQREVWVPGGVRLLPEPPVISGGRTYAAVELAEWFGMEAIWDPRRRQLDLRSRD